MQTKADKGGGGSTFAIFLRTSFMDDLLQSSSPEDKENKLNTSF